MILSMLLNFDFTIQNDKGYFILAEMSGVGSIVLKVVFISKERKMFAFYW